MLESSKCIVSAEELHKAIQNARATNQKVDGYLKLPRPVCLNWTLGVSEGKVEGSFTQIDLQGIDLSGFIVSGDFRGTNLCGANLSATRIEKAHFESIEIQEGCPPPDLFGGGPLTWTIPKKQVETNLTDVNLSNSAIESSDFRQSRAKNIIATNCKFERCQLAGADFRDADLRGTIFDPSCDLRRVDFRGARRLTSDHAIEVRQGAEALHQVALGGALVSLIGVMLRAQRVSETWSSGLVVLTLLIYVFFMGYRLLTFYRRKGEFPELSTPLMLALVLEGCLSLFHDILDPEFEMPPGAYLLVLWVSAALVFVLVRLIRYGDFFRRALISRHFAKALRWRPETDLATLLSVALGYTLLWFVLHHLFDVYSRIMDLFA